MTHAKRRALLQEPRIARDPGPGDSQGLHLLQHRHREVLGGDRVGLKDGRLKKDRQIEGRSESGLKLLCASCLCHLFFGVVVVRARYISRISRPVGLYGQNLIEAYSASTPVRAVGRLGVARMVRLGITQMDRSGIAFCRRLVAHA